MSSSDAKFGPGGHYSGRNPIPTVQHFIENLDRDKKDRDARIAEAAKENKNKPPQAGADVQDHQEGKPKGVPGTKKKVTDPVTGNEVEIEDVDAEFMKTVDEPVLSVPNANLGKETVSAYPYGRESEGGGWD